MVKIKRTVFILLVLLPILCNPLTVYGMDSSFVDSSNMWSWYSEADAVHLDEESITSFGGEYTGSISYFSDTENKCFYLRIFYRESSLTSENKSVYVDFNIKNPSRVYQFSVDENGFFNCDGETEKSFNVKTSFGAASEQGQLLLVGIEFKNGKDKLLDNTVGFKLYVNGNIYNLKGGLVLEFSEPIAEVKPPSDKNDTQNNSEKPTKASTEKTTEKTKETTGDKNKVTDKGAATSEKTTAEKTTKYKYTGPAATTAEAEKYSYTNSQSYETAQEIAEEDGFTDEQIPEYGEEAYADDAGIITVSSGNKGRYSPISKALLASAGIMAAAGLGTVIYFSKKVSGNERKAKSKGKTE